MHGTTITLLNAGRKYLKLDSLAGKIFITSGLGGMSGAQAKAAVICGAITIVAEVNPSAAEKRHSQGWVMEKYDSLDEIVKRYNSMDEFTDLTCSKKASYSKTRKETAEYCIHG